VVVVRLINQIKRGLEEGSTLEEIRLGRVGLAGEIQGLERACAEVLLRFGLGLGLGIIFVKSEVISWFRIQEMFRFQSFHMYGIIGSAVVVGALSVWLIRRYETRSWRGGRIMIPPKERTPWLRRYWIGGTIFGFGWALLGACPGPIFALIGTGATVLFVGLASALAGTWTYAYVRQHLPH
jgi:uncharacterized membrane protein YedE/YeeE